jgi:hypothetical protein
MFRLAIYKSNQCLQDAYKWLMLSKLYGKNTEYYVLIYSQFIRSILDADKWEQIAYGEKQWEYCCGLLDLKTKDDCYDKIKEFL